MKQKRIYALTPATEWMEGLPIGNGRLAAMVWGDAETDRLDLNHEWLWLGRNRNRRCPDVAEHLGEVRDCIRREDWEKAAELGNRYFGGTGGLKGPSRVDPYQPAGDLTFHLENAPAFTSRELDLETGLVRTLRGPMETRAFTSCTEGTILCRWEGKAPFSGEFVLSRKAQEGTALTFSTAPEVIRMDGAISGGTEFAVEVRLSTDGRSSVTGEGRVRVEDAAWITAEINMATFRKDLEKELAAYRFGGDFEKSFASHAERFRSWMNRFSLEIASNDPELDLLPTEERVQRVREGKRDNGLCQLYFDFGRYLLLSSSVCGELPANLQGKWNDNLNPPWDCDLHFDINLEMNYWMAEPTGLPECTEAFTKYMLSFLDSGREAAERLYGCRGIYLPIQTDAWGVSTADAYGWAVWIGAAPWLARQLWDHWRYTGDREYLARVYPFFTGVAEFYEDYLVRDPDGTYQILPSQSPENVIPGVTFPVLLAQSSAMDVQLCYDALGYAIQAAEILDRDVPQRTLWRSIRDHLPPFAIGSDGRLLEWDREFPEAEPGHRHLSHLYGLYPSDLFTPETRPEQYRAAVRSLDFRLSHGGGHTGWSRAWTACLRARTGNGKDFYEHFTALIKDFATGTLLDLHPPRIFQIDGNLGGVAAALETVAGFYDEKVHLLPALPEEWAEGAVRGLRLPGGHQLSMTWKNGRPESVEVVLGFSGQLTAAYAGKEQTVSGAPGERVQLQF